MREAGGFGDPERYDRARPRYPDALVARIVAASPGPDILDVGCGTGIAARQFRAAGGRVLGIEPDARMADFARRTGMSTRTSPTSPSAPATSASYSKADVSPAPRRTMTGSSCE